MVSPATYVTQAASIDLFVIRSSELTLTRSSNPRIRQFASAMIAAHKGTASQLSFAGRRLDLLPPANMLPQHQAMMEELAGSSDFDRAYIRLQRSVHVPCAGVDHIDFSAGGGYLLATCEFSGQVLKVFATDPGSVKDFLAFARQTGNALLSHTEENSIFVFLMRKK